MTHRYDDRNPDDALYCAARTYPGGIEALAARMGMSAKVLYKKLGPKVDSHRITFDEVQLILDYLVEAGMEREVDQVINAFCWRHDRAAVPLPDHFTTDAELFSQVVDILNSNGVLASGLRDALLDDEISDREMAQFDRDFRTCIMALIRLHASVEVKYVEGK